jgi:pilus assembly protein TadC
MKPTKLPFELLPVRLTNKFSLAIKGLLDRFERLVPGLKYDLVKSEIDVTPIEYAGYAFFNSGIIALFSLVTLTLLSIFVAGREVLTSLSIGIGTAFLLFLLFFVVLLKYPSIIAGKISEQVDKNLIYGLKDLLLQLSSGITLYNAIANVAESNYGQISKEFGKVAKNVRTGMPLVDSLEKMAVETRSKFLKRTVWQMVNSIKAGSEVKSALASVINELMTEQRNNILKYSKELNLWTLMYMLFAVAIPSIGGTLLIVLSSFSGVGVSKSLFVAFLVVGCLIQVMLIELVKSRRPVINL